MNRRNFIRSSIIAGITLAVSRAPGVSAEATPRAALRLQDGRVVDAAGVPQANFGPDLRVTALLHQNGVWYARLEQQRYPFWLKSYNGRAWGSLDWQPRRHAPARL
ncbi:MAG: hypothetical protein CVU38_15620 [Chloroflexi bacterium HGW-Chloroflexi-1]|nr:MAG: hypothetical protein CVU38_15620 [Chloroflexi bacterium HGW-Chloroflexi-1]